MLRQLPSSTLFPYTTLFRSAPELSARASVLPSASDRNARVVDPSVRWKSSSTRAFLSDALGDRKSTRLNSSHVKISYAVFCLKKKNKYLHGIHFPSISRVDI